ncbi:MAG: prenyltransferase [Bryobacterales bacterium]|nr:prenyltransferase [Bryobacterales bacterium]
MHRRTFVSLAALSMAAHAAPVWPDAIRQRILRYIETLRRPEGAYGWRGDVTAQVSPTFGVVGSYRLLGLPVPEAPRVAEFVRTHYPVAERRRTERPLWRLDFEQMQTLLWLDEPVESFRPLAESWTKPADFTTNYELGGNPVLQHQAMAVRVRHHLGLSPAEGDGAWRDYFRARRRSNGTFNNTLASDGSDGHVMNTLWGLLAFECLGVAAAPDADLGAWAQDCQLRTGGFTYAPKAGIGAVEDIAYTWAALQVLERAGATARDAAGCHRWVKSLLTPEGGFQDRPGGEPNPMATYYALDCLRMLNHSPGASAKPAARARRFPVEPGMRVFSAQVQAPGSGSPREAVLLAKALGIHLWTAKNSPEGWVREARRIAAEEKAQVEFHIADEEYGTYVELPGLGCYSHLVDTLAPYGADTGVPLPKKAFPYPWETFRDGRLSKLRQGGGRLVWQFNENEELTRILLDEAAAKGTYSAIAAFHFGNENFLHSQPFLHRWAGRLPYVGLQDAHGKESWWWGKNLAAFRTLYVARDMGWAGWLEALETGRVMTVRHDEVTGWKTHYAGGSPELREFVNSREAEWRWWGKDGRNSRLPLGALTLLRPGMQFEEGAPSKGFALRLRLAAETTNQGVPKASRAELVSLRVDGQTVDAPLRESKTDRYHLASLELSDTAGILHRAEADIKDTGAGRTETLACSWRVGA